MNAAEVKELIVSLFKESESFRSIGLDDDYYTLGVSSLTVIGLQIRVEEKVDVALETRELMSFSTINEWIEAYTARLHDLVEQA
ncbi:MULTISPECIES: acyl carrier protein [unclassified Massilia]|uniref:acyl carrier protein n=1 Tax=unclassified Massilia TaxID=2609279 RepID=UPI001780B84E|nr:MULTISPECIES: acyl carrier protein [unclassified Massilia]MBD8529978.1 acyl carrier protein [Massilia sp. CFBP 13647]MBD8673896.1 acyl carrier protein [Massilia sp. CFBP 13721]